MSNASNGIVCTTDGLAGIYCLSYREGNRLVVVAVMGFVSLSAIITVLTLILRNVIRAQKWPSGPNQRLIKVPMDIFMLSLFAADLLQSLGVILEVKWINDGKVSVGHLCTAQGVMLNLGETAIAMTTLIITLHTFSAIWWGNGIRSLVVACILVGVLWFFLIPFVAISASVHSGFYIPTPYWCWINSAYPDYRTAGENFWLWLAFAASVLYLPLFFFSRGYITPSANAWWRFQIHSKRDMRFESPQQTRFSASLILCPCICHSRPSHWPRSLVFCC